MSDLLKYIIIIYYSGLFLTSLIKYEIIKIDKNTNLVFPTLIGLLLVSIWAFIKIVGG